MDDIRSVSSPCLPQLLAFKHAPMPELPAKASVKVTNTGYGSTISSSRPIRLIPFGDSARPPFIHRAGFFSSPTQYVANEGQNFVPLVNGNRR